MPLGRRFRALKLWFVLRTYGRAGLQAYLRHHLALAASVEARVRADARFELAAPPRFSLVCFRLKARGALVAQAPSHWVTCSPLLGRTESRGTMSEQASAHCQLYLQVLLWPSLCHV